MRRPESPFRTFSFRLYAHRTRYSAACVPPAIQCLHSGSTMTSMGTGPMPYPRPPLRTRYCPPSSRALSMTPIAAAGAGPAAASPSPPASCVRPRPFSPPLYRALPLALAPRVRIDPSVVRELRNRRPHAPRHRCALCSAALLRIPITASASPVPGGARVFFRRRGRRHSGRVNLLLFSSRPRPARSTLPSASSSSPHSSAAPPPHPLRCPRPPHPPPSPSSSLHPVPPTADRHFLRSQDTETVLCIRQSTIDGEGDVCIGWLGAFLIHFCFLLLLLWVGFFSSPASLGRVFSILSCF
ncbi:hypothetical protein B0H14DRAFT_3871199, partial [Mycena olivaceomarginata]